MSILKSNATRVSLPVPFYTVVFIFVSTALLALGCNSTYTPKPKGYFKISFPEKAYQVFDKPGYPYRFEYPVYATVIQDTTFFEEKPENPYWLNIDFPAFHARIYISYNIIGGRAVFKVRRNGQYADSVGVNTLDRLVSGSFNLTFKHSYKASSIVDSAFITPHDIPGIYFKIGGNTATANQFLVTDSARNFMRGALYFDATPNEDSLGVVNNFLKEDMKHLINTLKWK